MRSSSGTSGTTTRKRSGRCVRAAPARSPPLLSPTRPSRSARRDALGDERLGDGVEVVEGVLLALEPAVVPLGLAELAAAAQVREDERAARLDEGGELAEKVGRPHAMFQPP